jgi:hypothetical protein
MLLLNRKYNIFNVPCVKNEPCHKFFNNCFYECIESKENPEILFEILKNNMFMLDDYERIYYSMMYLMYLNSLKKINNQIVMNFDYHLKVKTDEWNEFIKTFKN